MNENELKNYLIQNYPVEDETCEWKEFYSLKHSTSGDEGKDIISYISAISNMNGGQLVVGVEDQTMNIRGIKDFNKFNRISIKLKILLDCTNLSSEKFEIEEFITDDTRKIVWIFHIPKHSYRLPVYAHRKSWQRIGDSLVEMTRVRLNAILSELRPSEDWSAEIINEATLEDLDQQAIERARIEFKKRNTKYKEEVDKWDDKKFLDKAKITKKGKITRTAMILLGKDEEEHFLGSRVKIRWNLKTIDNQDKDFEIFSIPFLLTVDEVCNKIRNLKYRYLRKGTMFPDEFLKYEPFSIRESIHNALAHQDYTYGARINVVEIEDDHLIFSNYGSFLPKSVEDVVLKDSPEEFYRNPFLVEAMKNLDMIETQGGGLRKIFNYQKQRFFPMPDFDFSDNKVKVIITGKVIDDEFANTLSQNPDISMSDILLLDKVQKKKYMSDDEFKYLKKKKYVEGRKPNIYISKEVIEPVKDEGMKANYIRNKGFDDTYCKDLILNYIKEWGSITRNQAEKLLWDKLSDVLSDDSKKNKVQNLFQKLKSENRILLIDKKKWVLRK
jgi:ATP-dependent DNA helicase RecG